METLTINSTTDQTIKTPPFWIDMSKLFELYVLGLLKDRFENKVKYHFSKNWQELDYLLKIPGSEMVVDAKYKEVYKNHYKIEDIRQVSGYARLKSVYKVLEKKESELIDCLIIYPDQKNGKEDFNGVDLKETPISEFVSFYKFAIKIPSLK